MIFLKDKKNINTLYINNDYLKKQCQKLYLKSISEIDKFSFYKIKNEDIILKITGDYNCKEEENIVDNLCVKQISIKDIDFPIGKIKNMNDNHIGQILKYYPNNTSIHKALAKENINNLKRLYNHSEDKAENIIILLKQILNIIEELLDNQIYYLDIHPKNFLIVENNLKLVDYESNQIYFHDTYKHLYTKVLYRYIDYINNLLNNLKIDYKLPYNIDNINNEILKLENKLRFSEVLCKTK